MKNLLFVIGFLFLTSSFTFTGLITNRTYLRQDQENLFKGYVMIQGQFKEIDLYFTVVNGYNVFSRWSLSTPLEYNAQTRNLPSRGDGNYKRATPLNQQNQYAIQYNFNYCVETYYGTAYFRAN